MPYGVKLCCTANPKINGHLVGIIGERVTIFSSGRADFTISDIRPYLRPMSSMTEEEEIEYDATFATIKVDGHYDSTMTYKSFDFLNAHYFDYRGLIQRGLAIEVTEKNNPYK